MLHTSELPKMDASASASAKMAGAPKVYTGPTCSGGRMPRCTNMSISSAPKQPPSECPYTQLQAQLLCYAHSTVFCGAQGTRRRGKGACRWSRQSVIGQTWPLERALLAAQGDAARVPSPGPDRVTLLRHQLPSPGPDRVTLLRHQLHKKWGAHREHDLGVW